MNDQPSNPTPGAGLAPELEARVVAWVLGEASAFEVAELERCAAEQPAVAAFKQQIEAAHRQVVFATAPDLKPLRLSPSRRKLLLALTGLNASHSQVGRGVPAESRAPVARKQKRPVWQRVALYAAAACVIGGVLLSLSVGQLGTMIPVSPGYADREAAIHDLRQIQADADQSMLEKGVPGAGSDGGGGGAGGGGGGGFTNAGAPGGRRGAAGAAGAGGRRGGGGTPASAQPAPAGQPVFVNGVPATDYADYARIENGITNTGAPVGRAAAGTTRGRGSARAGGGAPATPQGMELPQLSDFLDKNDNLATHESAGQNSALISSIEPSRSAPPSPEQEMVASNAEAKGLSAQIARQLGGTGANGPDEDQKETYTGAAVVVTPGTAAIPSITIPTTLTPPSLPNQANYGTGAATNNRSLSDVFNGVNATQTGGVLIPAQPAVAPTSATAASNPGLGSWTAVLANPDNPGLPVAGSVTIDGNPNPPPPNSAPTARVLDWRLSGNESDPSQGNNGVSFNQGAPAQSAQVAAPTTGSTLMFDGGSLPYAGSSATTTDRLFTVGSGGIQLDVSGSGALMIGTGAIVNGDGQPVAGAGTAGDRAAKIGLATVPVTGSNSYGGGTVVNAGALVLGADGAARNGPGQGPGQGQGGQGGPTKDDLQGIALFSNQVNNSTGATEQDKLRFEGITTAPIALLQVSGASKLDGKAAKSEGAVTVSGGVSGSTGTVTASSFALQSGLISGALAGSGSELNKSSSGMLVLGAANTYTGGTTVAGGTLAVGNGASNTIGYGGPLTPNTEVTAGAIWNGNFSYVGNNNLELGSGAATAGSGANRTGGNPTISANSALDVMTGNGTITSARRKDLAVNAPDAGGIDEAFLGQINTLSSGVLATGATTGNFKADTNGQTLSVSMAVAATGGPLNIGGVISDGGSSFGLTKAGNGTLTVGGGGETYTGETTLNAGTLLIGNATALGTLAGTTAPTGRGRRSGGGAGGGGRGGPGGVASQPGDVTAVALASNEEITVTGGTLTVGGSISDLGLQIAPGKLTGVAVAQNQEMLAQMREADAKQANSASFTPFAHDEDAGPQNVPAKKYLKTSNSPAAALPPSSSPVALGSFVAAPLVTISASGLQMALGQLKAYAGADQRITLPAEFADTSAQAAAQRQTLAEIASAEVKTADEQFSTFSLHVSDVSFKLAQSALAQGQRPDPDSIRPEEFYNAFDYGDPSPSLGEPVACRIEQSAHPVLQQRNLVRIALRVPATGRDQAQPLHLTVLLDTSGSMERTDRAASVHAALATLASLLKPNDLVTLIGFSRTPRLLAQQLPGSQAAKLVALTANLPFEGGTNLEEALKLAGTEARRMQLAGAQNRIVLLTDGAANLGDANPEQLSQLISTLRQQGISLDACGVGTSGVDDDILEALTRKGDGRYYLLKQPEDADASFARQLAGAFRPAAENVKVQVRFNPARVASYRLIGFEQHRLKTEDFHNDQVTAAQLAAEEAAVALYQVEVLPDGEGDLGEVSVRFHETATDSMIERTWTIFDEPEAKSFDRSTPTMQLAGTAAMMAEKLHGGAMASLIRLETLAPVVNNLRGRYASEPRVQELATMYTQMRRMFNE